MSRIIVNIDPDLHRKLKALALELNEKGEDDPMDKAVDIGLAVGFANLPATKNAPAVISYQGIEEDAS